MEPTTTKTPSRVTAELVERLAVAALAPKLVPGFTPFVLVPEGFEAQEMQREHLEELPDYIRQAIVISELESFISYVKQFQTHTARIFAVANDVGAKFDAVLDYHEGGKEGKPHRGTHRVTFHPVYSTDYMAWANVNGKPLTQEQFLDHLRKWGDTITNQSDADLIELASSLDFSTEGQYSSHVERVKGGRKLLFNEVVEGSANVKGKTVSVPEQFGLKLPIFVGGKEYEMGADLLYRPQGGALRIIVELRRPHLVVRQAVKDIVADVKAGTEIEPFIGRIE